MILDVAITSKSGRIILVPPASDEDDGFVAELRAHPETRRYLRYFPERVSVADARARRLSRASDPTLVDFHIYNVNPARDGLRVDKGAVAAPAHTFVGTTGIFHVELEYGSACEVGILISPEYFRGGLATDALYTVLVYVFEERKFNRAEFNTGADNAAMRGWLENAGAALEGTQRQLWVDPGVGYTDVCKYSILYAEWTATVKGRLEAKIERSLKFASSDGA
ncbi:acyl-CoA N-acyltransferase [Mycena filopes]|nr:acyl-CoA N-acyltransferase [Mycena filopes]